MVGLIVGAIVLAWTNPTGNPTTGGGALYYSGGNVGIGNTSPSYALDVTGTFRATATSTFSGNVGIGTTAPVTALQINHDNNIVYLQPASGISSTNGIYTFYRNSGGQLIEGVESSTPGSLILTGDAAYSSNIGSNNATSLNLGTNATVRMTIDSTGNVGIGTTAPATALDVNGDIVSKGETWTDYSATSTITGWVSVTPGSTAQIYYKLVGKLVFVTFYISGTSNSSSASFTLPYTSKNQVIDGCVSVDNGGPTTVSQLFMNHASAVVYVYKDMAGDGFTASGTKTIECQLWYQRS